MKCHKSLGIDGIPAEVYKVLPDSLVNLLTEIFNAILTTGEYPDRWSQGLICPVYKAGNNAEPNSYRGITLLNCIGKIFTSDLLSEQRITIYYQKCNMVAEKIEEQQIVFSS